MSDTPQEVSGLPSPDFRLEDDLAAARLYLQTFDQSPANPEAWVSRPPSEWHLLAVIEPHQITAYPVYTNPYAKRYLQPKHGQFVRLVLERNSSSPMPQSADEAVRDLAAATFGEPFDDPEYGFGFDKDLDPLRYSLAALRNVDTIKLFSGEEPQLDGRILLMPVAWVGQFRRAFERNRRLGRERVRSANSGLVRSSLLSEIDPERFPRIVPVDSNAQLVQVRLDRTRRTATSARMERATSVRAVRENLQAIASDMPRELFELHSEIERVTLAKMVERYEAMLQQNLSEARWQRFFEGNIFILSMVFTRPVRLLHTQFHAQGSGLDGKGAQVGDFLLAEHGAALAIVEIKKPGTELMLNSAYRNTEVFGPNAELSGAITQVLYQQSALRSHWLSHQSSPKLRDSRPDSIRCVVIAGTSPTDEMKRRSFEIFRNACKDVDVVTFDELLEKLRLMLSHLNAANEARNSEVPF
ncbi:Shedu immune nuclease family protein [Paraburkholderia sp. BR13444]|uniref:Shedu immune nuclease family protein n=1 Tax=Paraburkholderia sp. BR13444 TaxID=3236997 RepID=UPI0034CFBC78